VTQEGDRTIMTRRVGPVRLRSEGGEESRKSLHSCIGLMRRRERSQHVACPFKELCIGVFDTRAFRAGQGVPAQEQGRFSEHLVRPLTDEPLRAAHIGYERGRDASFLQPWQQIENSSDRSCQDNEIRPVDGLGRIGIPLIDHFPANRAVNYLLTIAADAPARKARSLERQPPRSAHQAQTDNRDAVKGWL
jgi:hypothetical protein